MIYVVADNPIGESVYYHDSKKWGVRSPEWRVLRGDALEHSDGEESLMKLCSASPLISA